MDRLEQMKKSWGQTKIDSPASALDNVVDEITSSKLRSTRNKIARQICRQIALCVIAPLIIPAGHLLAGIDFPAWFTVLYTTFFLVMALLHFLSYKTLTKIDLVTMNVVTACEAILRYRRQNICLRLVRLALGVVVAAALIYVFCGMGDTTLVICCWAGLVAGGIIGIMIHRRQLHHINLMLDQVKTLNNVKTD